VPAGESAPVGAPVWIDLATSDPARAGDFYTALFGWTAQESGEEFANYVNFMRDGALVAGMPKHPHADVADSWRTYLSTPDAKATADAAIAAGGRVLSDPMDMMGLGTMAVVGDSSGAVVGVWQPGTHRGYGVVAEAGAPVWHELLTKDYMAAVRFYEDAFGWKTSAVGDSDDFRYTVLVDDAGGQHAGIMDAAQFLPEAAPSAWYVYLGAEDVDATVTKAVELGGTVMQAAEDTPYGRLATVADPTGAVFKLSSLPS
jgi:predicted enzyme related to lactoylglutathione lyase